LINQAIADTAWEVAQGQGDRVIIDTAALSRARQEEQEATDAALILKAAKEAADDHLCQTVDGNAAGIIKALQDRYSGIAKTYVEAIRHLPEGLTERLALRLPAEIRQAWLDKEDALTELLGLRAMVATVADYREREAPDAMTLAASWVRSDALWRQHTPRGATMFECGAPGTEGFFESLARSIDHGDWWAPSLAEARRYAIEAGWGARRAVLSPGG
jgi:hypothetical protein